MALGLGLGAARIADRAADAQHRAHQRLLISKDDDRGWTGRIQRIVDRFKREQDKRITTPGDVTEHAIEQSLEAAFKKAKLDRFESFLGENWSAERLRVRILDRLAADLPHLFDGNNRGNAPMQDLDSLTNRSSALFVQRLYQTHGGLVDDQLREGADGMITKASNAAIGKLEGRCAATRTVSRCATARSALCSIAFRKMSSG